MAVRSLEQLSEVRQVVPNFGHLEKKKKMHEFSITIFFFYIDSVGTLPGYHMTPTRIKLNDSTQSYS